MKYIYYIILLVLFSGCIEEYTPTGIEEVSDLLVVEGTITDNESVFKLSRSVGLSETLTGEEAVNDAFVYVEKDNGDLLPGISTGNGTYVVSTGDLDAGAKYRFYAVVGDEEYKSDFLSPLFTPEIDSLNLTKRAKGETVYVCVSTHDPTDRSRYYLWSYKENWEVKAELFANYGMMDGVLDYLSLSTSRNTYYCWGKDHSKTMLLGSSEKLSENLIYQKRLKGMDCTSDKLSVLYYVQVDQIQIRKEAYDYYSNIQKNIEQTGSIFTPIPSEMKGNIYSVTNPDLPVIGYIDVSTTTTLGLFVPWNMGFYEAPRVFCFTQVTGDSDFAYPVYGYYEYYPMDMPPRITYAPHHCVDCRLKEKATKNKPDFWPNDHL
ncbi:MAG: DUF4249 domain-containing protein [Tannerella sp.]|jgi:hypothetical protein|nr:DUF4249 domain-containing protein [Tannerella sp.]